MIFSNAMHCIYDVLRCFDMMPERRRYFGSDYVSEVAGKYNRFDYAAEYDSILEGLLISNPKLIVDYGCNTGRLCAVLATRYPKAKVVGYDINKYALRQAKIFNPKTEFRHVVDEPSLAKGKADLVIMTHSLAFIPNSDEVLGMIHAGLKPAGRLVIVTPNARYMLSMILSNFFSCYRSDQNRLLDYTAERLLAKLHVAGFSDVNITTFGDQPRIKLFKRPANRSRLLAVAKKAVA